MTDKPITQADLTLAKLAEIEGLLKVAMEHDCVIDCTDAECAPWDAATGELVNAAPDLIAAARFGMEARAVIAQIIDAAWDSNPSDQSEVERIARAFLDAHKEDR